MRSVMSQTGLPPYRAVHYLAIPLYIQQKCRSMTPTLAARVSIPEHVIVQHLNNETMLLHLEQERYYGLDDVGFRMWAALQEHPTIGAACEALHTEYKASHDQLEQDLLALLEDPMANGLVELHEA